MRAGGYEHRSSSRRSTEEGYNICAMWRTHWRLATEAGNHNSSIPSIIHRATDTNQPPRSPEETKYTRHPLPSVEKGALALQECAHSMSHRQEPKARVERSCHGATVVCQVWSWMWPAGMSISTELKRTRANQVNRVSEWRKSFLGY